MCECLGNPHNTCTLLTQQNNRFVAFPEHEKTAIPPEQPEQGTPSPSLRLSRWKAVFLCLGGELTPPNYPYLPSC